MLALCVASALGFILVIFSAHLIFKLTLALKRTNDLTEIDQDIFTFLTPFIAFIFLSKTADGLSETSMKK